MGKERWILVWNKNKDIWFGRTDQPLNSKEFLLYDARHVTRYSGSNRGTGGLAVRGPDENCMIEPAVSEHYVTEVHQACVCNMDDEIKARWDAEYWR